MNNLQSITAIANSALDTIAEKWPIRLKACSFNGAGHVTSFIAVYKGQRFYGSRKHEFVNGAFTGKEWFVVEHA